MWKGVDVERCGQTGGPPAFMQLGNWVSVGEQKLLGERPVCPANGLFCPICYTWVLHDSRKEGLALKPLACLLDGLKSLFQRFNQFFGYEVGVFTLSFRQILNKAVPFLRELRNSV